MLQLSNGNGLIFTCVFIVILAVTVVCSIFAIPDIRNRRKIRRFLGTSGCKVVRIRRLSRKESTRSGYEGYTIMYHESGEAKEAEFRTVDGHHFHVFYDLPEPSLLIYYNKDGSLTIHALPNSDLVSGEFLYYFRRIKYGMLTSLSAAIIVAFTIIAALFAIMDRSFSPPLNLSRELANVTSVPQAILFAMAAVGAVCFILAAPILASLTYRYLRCEFIMSDKPICLNCEYDLCGNESEICPECGEKISEQPPWVTRAGKPSPWAGRWHEHPLGRIKNWRRGDLNP